MKDTVEKLWKYKEFICSCLFFIIYVFIKEVVSDKCYGI